MDVQLWDSQLRGTPSYMGLQPYNPSSELGLEPERKRCLKSDEVLGQVDYT